jgi:hypothetical protein
LRLADGEGKMRVLVTIVVLIVAAFFIIPFFVKDRPVGSAANTCYCNMRNIEIAKNLWALNNNKGTNKIPSWDDIKLYLFRDQPYYQFNPTNHLPHCPLGGIYTIGKISELALPRFGGQGVNA